MSEYTIETVLKSQISKSHSKYLGEKQYNEFILKSLFKAWAKTDDKEAVWDFIDSARPIYVKWDSKELGIEAIVKEYITKSGKRIMAYHTINGKYIRTVKKDEDKDSKYYRGYFKISRDIFDIDFKLNTKHNEFVDILKPKKTVCQTYTNDEVEIIEEFVREIREHDGTIRDLKLQMKCEEIPYYKDLVSSIINSLNDDIQPVKIGRAHV
jgi:hypothetical protein